MLILNIIVVTVVLLGAVVVVLRKIWFSETSSAVNRLNEEQVKFRKKQEEMAEKMKRFDEDCKAKVAATQKESDDLKAKIIEEAEKKAAQISDKARLEAEDMIKKAYDATEVLKANLIKESNAKSVDYAGKVLAQVLQNIGSEDLNDKVIANYIKELEALDPKFMAGMTEVELISAYELKDDCKERIREILSKKTNCDLKMKEKVDPSIVAGILLKFQTMILDGSMLAKIKETVEATKDELFK